MATRLLGGIEKYLSGLLPVLALQVGKLPIEEKLTFAQYIRDLAQAYETGDKLSFERLLDTGEMLTPSLRASVMTALWANDTRS